MSTPDLYGVKKTNMDCSLAMIDAIVKAKKIHWGIVYNQYTDVIKITGEPIDHTITHYINLVGESAQILWPQFYLMSQDKLIKIKW